MNNDNNIQCNSVQAYECGLEIGVEVGVSYRYASESIHRNQKDSLLLSVTHHRESGTLIRSRPWRLSTAVKIATKKTPQSHHLPFQMLQLVPL